MSAQITLGSFFEKYAPGYIHSHKLTGQEKGILSLLSMCRSNGLGAHKQICTHCGYDQINYNSCRNRHCPTCQQDDKQKWLEKRMEELLPTGYFHIVFTIPHQLNRISLQNRKVMYDILFKAASQTILELAADPKHLGAETGLLAMLHTWGQSMIEHIHLHCIVPAGGFTGDHAHWVHCREDFFAHVKVVSSLFKGKFLDMMKKAYAQGQLQFKQSIAGMGSKKGFQALLDQMYNKKWVVNIQPPFGRAEKVLEYLSRYVNRIAITDRRILRVRDGKVLFSWKNNRSKRYGKMELPIDEFISRFLLHLLPERFQRIRYYGLFANRYRKENIRKARECIQAEEALRDEQRREDGQRPWEKQDPVWEEILQKILTWKKPNCPACKQGRLVFAGLVKESPG